MSNVRSRFEQRDMRRVIPVLAIYLCFASAAWAGSPKPAKVALRLLSGTPPPGWTLNTGASSTESEIVLLPASGPESEVLSVSECAAAREDCLSTCNEAAATNYLYFFKNNEPPAGGHVVSRADGLFKYRAAGRFGASDIWVAAAVLCGKSGLAVVLAQSATREQAVSYVQAFVGSVKWRP